RPQKQTRGRAEGPRCEGREPNTERARERERQEGHHRTTRVPANRSWSPRRSLPSTVRNPRPAGTASNNQTSSRRNARPTSSEPRGVALTTLIPIVILPRVWPPAVNATRYHAF